jgi:hypothetical protein
MMLLLATAALLAQGDTGQTRLLDRFEDVTPWSAHPADGVSLRLSGDSGYRGRALRLDFSFAGGAGYAIARRRLPVDLPANYAFTFWIRGQAPPNTLEFKLVDSTGENVWWYTERDRHFSADWQRVTIRKRQIGFAWGPAGGGELERMASLEIVITAGRGGGTGSVWVDELALAERPEPRPYAGTPAARSTVEAPGHPARLAVDGDTATAWRSAGAGSLDLDFGERREFGGVTLVWEARRGARDYQLLTSHDGRSWETLRPVRGSNGGRDHLFLPDGETRFLRILPQRSLGNQGYGLAEVLIRPLEFGASPNAFFTAIAAESRPGTFPRYFLEERAWWTVVGAPGAREEALFSEDGAVDAGPGAFSVEPFLWTDSLITWRNSRRRLWLEQGELPIPTTAWVTGALELAVTGFAAGTAEQSSAVIRYRVRNRGQRRLHPTLYLAVRPFQVNPPWQFLGVPGGAARLDSIRWTGTELRINGDRRVIPLVAPASVGVASFAGGEIAEHLARRRLPAGTAASDPMGAASAGMAWPLTLAPGDSTEVAIEIPLKSGAGSALRSATLASATAAFADAVREWRGLVDGASITLPGEAQTIARTIRSTIGWILVNRDGPAIQPGSRSYERAWIRDGSLTSAALLRLGRPEPVREFIEWYQGFQYPDGKVPCCVDYRGADPVPEHDSHGEFIYLVMEYWRHTGDRALLERMWPRVSGAVGYIDSLRQTRRTSEYQSGAKQIFFGLLPPSISHEGYSAKPMHSYWDDFFALRGLKDASVMAGVLGRADDARRIAAIRDEFQRDLYASLDAAMKHHGIRHIPGAADLGDFDPTSTTIALNPGGEQDNLPQRALQHTFDRYWTEVQSRRDSLLQWEAYTPYELRSVGAMIRLGHKDRALSLLRMFLGDREPREWNQWPEVVWRDRREPKFIGDSPHTWVGSDFLRSVLDLFVYENEADSSLILGAGIPDEWLGDGGLRVERIHTWWGPVSYQARLAGNAVHLRIEAGTRIPPGGLVVKPPGSAAVKSITLNGRIVQPARGGDVVVRQLPADLRFAR